MIGCFPDPYPDELLYSVCARYSQRMHYPNRLSVLQDLFGVVTTPVIDLPGHLEALTAALPPGSSYSVDYFIDKHTLLPLYRPFLAQEKYAQLRIDMAGNVKDIHLRAATVYRNIRRLDWFRFCPICVEVDRSEFGESYWHRVHQIIGVEICPIHEVWLESSTAPTPRHSQNKAFVTAEEKIVLQKPQPIDPANKHDCILRAIAADIMWLLNYRGAVPDRETLSARYRALLATRQLASKKRIRQIQSLIKTFIQHYSTNFLDHLGCNVDENGKQNWLIRLTHDSVNIPHPLYHILLIHFLNHTIDSAFNVPTEPLLFGKGPWSCINPVCDQYRQLVINDCTLILNDSTKPVGIFTCACGCVYSQSGYNREREAWEQTANIREYGARWKGCLQQLWMDTQVNLKEMAQKLGVSISIVKRQGFLLGLPFPIPGTRSKIPGSAIRELSQREGFEIRREHHRTEWLHMLEADKNLTRTQFKEKYQTLYSWLYQRDKDWLQNHRLPPSPSRNRRQSNIDWSKRDITLAGKVEERAMQIQVAPGRPRKITVRALFPSPGDRAMVIKYRDRLPYTTAALAQIGEPAEKFAIRLVKWASADVLERGVKLTQREFIKHARVEKWQHHLDVHNAIEEALAELSES